MRPLSATDAIGPAWNHTTRLVLAPRNWRLALKICAVAVFAQVGGCNSSFHNPGHQAPHLPPAWIAALVGLALLIGVISLILWLVFFYLGSRLQFVLFELVLRSDSTIAPIWRRYGRATWHWMALKVLFVLAALACLTPILIPMIIHFIHGLGPGFHEGSLHNPARFIMTIIGFIGALFFILLAIGIGYTLLRDFGLPSMALESTPMSVTVGRVWSLFRAEPGQVILYLLMRFLLNMAGAICAYIALVLSAVIALIPFGGAGVLAWVSLRHSGIAGHAVMVAAWAVLGLILTALVVIAAIMLFGYITTFLQAYALYFLGGRYPLVGQYLEPFLPPVYSYPVAAPPYPQPPHATNSPSLPIEGEP
jgi:hypothetical protein